MDHLYSPWRYRYLTEPRPADADACVFCAQLTRSDEEALVVHRGAHNAILLNLYPYTSGHILIVPHAHVATLGGCAPEARAEMLELAVRAEAVLGAEYRPQGINVGLNLGEAAGAGIAGHLHLHVVPRWFGDANFMTVVGETRVLPETLEQTYRRLRGAFRQAAAGVAGASTPPTP